MSIFQSDGTIICPVDEPTAIEVGVDDTSEVIIDNGQGHMPPSSTKRNKIYVDGVAATILAERVEYLDANGKLITESLKDFSKRTLQKQFKSLDTFINKWNHADRKTAILEELETAGLLVEALQEITGPDIDPFDVILSVAFDQPVKTRKDRARVVREGHVLDKYAPEAKSVLEALLQKYQDEGELNLNDSRILTIPPVSQMGTPIEIVRWFGSKDSFDLAVRELQDAIYKKVA